VALERFDHCRIFPYRWWHGRKISFRYTSWFTQAGLEVSALLGRMPCGVTSQHWQPEMDWLQARSLYKNGSTFCTGICTCGWFDRSIGNNSSPTWMPPVAHRKIDLGHHPGWPLRHVSHLLIVGNKYNTTVKLIYSAIKNCRISSPFLALMNWVMRINWL
jgi:hypothetical protein